MQQPSNISRRSRIQGAIMGAFIGDALALGPHWYYDLEQLRAEYGDWITTYTAPKPGRYHAGQAAGSNSQSGFILNLLLQSLVAKSTYDQHDFTQRVDNDLFTQLDGTPNSGPGGYTSQSIRESWAKRQQGNAWGAVAGLADNTDAAERIIAIAVRYAFNYADLTKHVAANTALFQQDPTVLAMTTAYGCLLGALIRGIDFNADISDYFMDLAKSGELPFFGISYSTGVPAPGQYPSPEPLLMYATAARLAHNPHINIEPASAIAQVYGLPCAIYNQLPSVYYLAARFQGDFTQAVLHAVNSGGQNMARAMLTGALSGAIGGIESIPDYLIEGLLNHQQYLSLADKLAEQIMA